MWLADMSRILPSTLRDKNVDEMAEMLIQLMPIRYIFGLE